MTTLDKQLSLETKQLVSCITFSVSGNMINFILLSRSRLNLSHARVLSSLNTIVKAGGKIVPSLVNRNGHRNQHNSGRKYYPRKTDQVIANMDDMGIFKETQQIAIEENMKEAINYYRNN